MNGGKGGHPIGNWGSNVNGGNGGGGPKGGNFLNLLPQEISNYDKIISPDRSAGK